MEISTDTTGAGSSGEIPDISGVFGHVRGEDAGTPESRTVEKEIRLIYELIAAMAESFEAVRADQKKIREDMAATVEFLGKLIKSQPFMDMTPKPVPTETPNSTIHGRQTMTIEREENMTLPPPPPPPREPVFRNGRTYV